MNIDRTNRISYLRIMPDRAGSAAWSIHKHRVERPLERYHSFSIILSNRNACRSLLCTVFTQVLYAGEVDVAGDQILIPARRDHRSFPTRSCAYVENSRPALGNNGISYKLRTFVLKIDPVPIE